MEFNFYFSVNFLLLIWSLASWKSDEFVVFRVLFLTSRISMTRVCEYMNFSRSMPLILIIMKPKSFLETCYNEHNYNFNRVMYILDKVISGFLCEITLLET